MAFYQRLKDLRDDKDLRQKDVAKIINTSSNYYGNYESGKRPIPFERVIELANFYNVSIDYIAGRTTDKRGLTRSELSDKETELIKKFRSLSESGKGRILERMDIIVQEESEELSHFKEVG